jgi:hypothetical protein
MSEDKQANEFWKEFWVDSQNTAKNASSKFAIQPVPPSEFFAHWLQTPLFPRQQKAVDAAFTKKGDLSEIYNEFVLAWGKGSGKDLTIANLLCYICYWLCCLNDPQETLGIKSGEPIDIVNVSFDADQAKSVFFEKFARKIRDAINPGTGKNFFEEQGMDIEKAIVRDAIIFPKNIRCWSLNSKEFKAEGKNILCGIFDEIGQFRWDKAEAIYDHIKSSAKTRFGKVYKLFFISFLTSGADYMAHLIDEAEGGAPKTYFDRAATWEIRSAENCPKELLKYTEKQENYTDDYDKDPGSAMLKYECKVPKFRSNNFIKQAVKITNCVQSSRKSPIIFPEKDKNEQLERFWVYNPNDEEYESWFRPGMIYEVDNLIKEYEQNPNDELEKKIKALKEQHKNAEYFVHIDLSRGVVDTAGLVLGHVYYVLDKKKIYVDLMMQIRAEIQPDGTKKEIDLEQILDFVIKVLKKEKKFNLVKLTMDGWNSALFMQICEKNKIPAELLSIDKDSVPYDTLKDFLYREDLNMYFYPPAIRELTELIVDEAKKKVDHPKKSQWRMREEGLPRGSKDIADCLAGIVTSATKADDEEPLAYGST